MPDLYRIKDWRENFENKRTIEFGVRLHIDICTKYSSYEIRDILKHEDGGWHFTFWILLLEWHARSTPPREGWITHNGKVDGIPLTPNDLQEELRIPSKFIKIALERLSSDPINWITVERSVNTVEQQSNSSVNDALPTLILTQPNPTKPNQKRVRREYPAVFERLWGLHKKGGKDAAYKAFKKCSPDEEELTRWVEKIEAYKGTKKWEEGISPNMSTWITQGYFDGDVPDEKKDPWDQAIANVQSRHD